MDREGVNIAEWARSVKRGKEASIKSLTEEQGYSIKERETRKAFHQHFAQLFGRSGGLYRGSPLTDFLDCGQRITISEAECTEGPETAAEVKEVLAECPMDKSP